MPESYTLPLTAAEIQDALISSRKQNITVVALVAYVQTLTPKPTEDKVFVTGGRDVLGDAPQRLWVVRSGARTENFGTLWTIDSSYYIEMLNWDGDVRDFATEGDAEVFAFSVEHDQNIKKYEGPRTISNVDVKSGGITNAGLYNGYDPLKPDLSNLAGTGIEFNQLSQNLQDTIDVGFDPADFLGTWNPATNVTKFNGVAAGTLKPAANDYWQDGGRQRFSSNWDGSAESINDTSHIKLASTINFTGDFNVEFSLHLADDDIGDTSNTTEMLLFGGSSANFIRIRSSGTLANKAMGIKIASTEYVVASSNLSFALNRTYRFKITRSGTTMNVFLDGSPIQTFTGVSGTFSIAEFGSYVTTSPAYFFRNAIFDLLFSSGSVEHKYAGYGSTLWTDIGTSASNNGTPYSGTTANSLTNFELIYQTETTAVGDWYYIEASGTASGTNADGTYAAGDYLVVTDTGYAQLPNQAYLVDGSVSLSKLESTLSVNHTKALHRSKKLPSIIYNGTLKNLGLGVKRRSNNNQVVAATTVPELTALGMNNMMNMGTHTGNKFVGIDLPEDFWKQMQSAGYMAQTFYAYCANGFTADTVLKTPGFYYEKNATPDSGTTVVAAFASQYGSGYVAISSNLRLYYNFCKLDVIADRAYRLLFGYAGQSGSTTENFLVGGFGLFYSQDQPITNISDLDYNNWHGAEGSFDALRWHKEVGEFYDLDQNVSTLTAASATNLGSITTLNSSVSALQTSVNSLSGVSLINDSIKLNNSDMITLHGDSYTESSYTPKGKHYAGKISNLSDWRLDSFLSRSGDTTQDQLEDVLNNADFAQLSPSYSIIITYTNDIKYVTEEELTADMENMIQAIYSVGSIPILATEYHMSGGSGMLMAYRRLADKYNIPVFNILPDSTVLRADTFPDSVTTVGDYAPFWSGTHPGVRSNDLFAHPLTQLVNQLPRPNKSLRLFRVRDEVVVSTLDDLRYRNVETRCELFKEIHGGHRHLAQEKFYDALNVSSSSTRLESEYNSLIDNASTAFNDYAVVEAILPYNVGSTTNLKLKLTSTSTLQVYVLDTQVAPYADAEQWTGFYTASNPSVTAGDVYTYNGKSYTVVDVIVDNARGLETTNNTIIRAVNNTYAANFDRSDKTTTDGVISFSSGNASSSSSITFVRIAEAFDPYWYSNYGKPQGHWVEVSETGSTGEFLVGNDIQGKVNGDKISFLIKKTGAFALTDVELTYASSRLSKINKGFTPDAYKLDIAEGSSYFDGSTDALVIDGAVSWTNIGASVLAKANLVDQVVPYGVTHVVELDTNDYVEKNLTRLTVSGGSVSDLRIEQPIIVEIWARRFPSVYDHTSSSYPTDAPISEDTFDYGKLSVEFTTYDRRASGSSRPAIVKSTELVPLHYSAIRIKTTIPANTNEVTLKLKALSDDIQIAKVSVNDVS